MHISYSEFSNWIHCPHYHKVVNIDKSPVKVDNKFTIFGKTLHETISNDLSKKEFDDIKFKETLVEELKRINEEDMDNFADIGCKILDNIIGALNETFEGFEVQNTEELLMEQIPDLDYQFKGYIDAIIKVKDKYYIIDWKTASWGWNARKKADKIITYQLSFYKYFYALKHNIPLKDIETYFVLLKRSNSSIEFVRVTSGNKKLNNAITLLKQAIWNIQRKNYIKNKLNCENCALHFTQYCTAK